MSYYLDGARDLAKLLAARTTSGASSSSTRSTVPIGTARLLEGVLKEAGAANVGVASNPEFLPEGDAVEKSRKPDRVVVGCDTEADFSILRRIYSQFVNHVRIGYIETTPETSEVIKYVANTLLHLHLVLERRRGAAGRNIPQRADGRPRCGVTADYRISKWGQGVSNGAGGSCFGKDIQSLIYH